MAAAAAAVASYNSSCDRSLVADNSIRN